MAAPYTSKIIKAGALLEDTRTLLLSWDTGTSPDENIDRIRSENALGKTSRSRLKDELAIFRQRYLSDPRLANALAILAQRGWSNKAMSRVLYFLSARNDRLLHDIVVAFLLPMYRGNRSEVDPSEVEARISSWVSEGKTISCWSNETVRRVAQGVLATLRDFDVLGGKAAKRITPPFLPAEAAAVIAFVLTQDGVSASDLTRSPEWELFFLDPTGVERLLLETHQRHLLEYQAAGRVVRVDFPAATLMEYARVIA